MLTEVRDCDLLIVVTSSIFLKRKDRLKEKWQLAQIIKARKRKDMLKEKRQLAQIIKARSPAYI